MTAETPLWVTLLVGLGGVAAGRFWMTKKEQKDVAQKNYENSMKIEDAYEGAYNTYVAAARAYIALEPPTQEAFTSLCVAGDNLFRQVGAMCNTINSGLVDPNFRENTWMSKIRTAWDITLPSHYERLQTEAAKRGFPYTGRLRRQDHEAIFQFSEKYGSTRSWDLAGRRDGEDDEQQATSAAPSAA